MIRFALNTSLVRDDQSLINCLIYERYFPLACFCFSNIGLSDW